MKLAKALKEKNRVVGDINRLQELLRRENSRETKSTSTVNVEKVWEDLQAATDRIVAIKTAIFKANVGIYDKIVRMGELKSRISFLDMVPTKDGVEDISYGMSTGVKEYKAWMNQQMKDNEVLVFEKQIADLQDEIDEYNATVEVNL